MLFNSLEYLFFFIAVFLIFWFLLGKHRKLQNIFLLIANYFFYSWWDWRFLSLIILVSAVNFYSGIQIGKTDPGNPGPKRKIFLIVCIVINLGLLSLFKYFNFFAQSTTDLLNSIGFKADTITLDFILPIGISFYTFQTLSYTIDVYRTKIEPSKDIISFFTYASFFPVILAGPIERAENLLVQFSKKREFKYEQAVHGLQLIFWGLFKKVVIADRLAILVDQIYGNPHSYSGVPLIIATYFYAFQIYCDFSGYSDIAIGSGKLLGFNLMTNFRTPYYSKDTAEFWRRWHISLSTWLRDYLFMPLNIQFRNLRQWGVAISLFFTFVLCGLWHGANWTFIVWGAIHGFYLITGLWFKGIVDKFYNFFGLKENSKGRNLINLLWTFHLILFAWIFFRANSLSDAFYILNNIFSVTLSGITDVLKGTVELGLKRYDLLIALVSIILMETVHIIQRKKEIRKILLSKSPVIRWGLYISAVFIILLFGVFHLKEFIYFQF